MITSITGINWGDEGKGRMVDLLSRDYDIVVRYQGGNNAGHTVVNEKGKFILNLLPSGILRDDTVNVLGPGMVIDVEHLFGEVKKLRDAGITITPDNLKISDRAVICMPYHKMLDCLEEDRLGDAKFGSTRRGIAPVYADRFMKKVFRMGELLHMDSVKRKMPGIIEWKNLTVHGGYGAPELKSEDMIAWLEEFLINFENTVIVVSHDRYFLNKVCTHIADIDYAKIQLYAGNYDFWYESSQLMIKQMKEANKKKEEKIKELQDFIQRFSANASKSKQATSRKRALEKIQLDEIRPSSRKYPYIDFRPKREIGNEVLTVSNISKTIDGVKVLDNISFTVGHDDKIAFVGPNTIATTTLFRILAGEEEPDEGSYKWGVTTSQGYFQKDNTKEFDNDLVIADWLAQYSDDKDATYVRGFLGRMLFAGEDGVKKVKVLSGGEKVRCLLSKLMIMGSNVLILDEPTNHLDMESITALNNGLIKFPGVCLFACQDHQFVQTTANRIMELTNTGLIDKQTTYDEYLANDELARKRQVMNMASDDQD